MYRYRRWCWWYRYKAVFCILIFSHRHYGTLYHYTLAAPPIHAYRDRDRSRHRYDRYGSAGERCFALLYDRNYSRLLSDACADRNQHGLRSVYI